MLDILLYVVAALALAIMVLALIASRRPDTFKIERSQQIGAAPDKVYPMIASLKAMNTWNPFVAPDPNIRLTYSGPEIGVGAKNVWAGNREVGEGQISVTQAAPNSLVVMRLQMVKPMAADNVVTFTLTPNGSQTGVTWSMSGKQPFLAKMMATVIDCDKMVGKRFEDGFAKLKSIVEK